MGFAATTSLENVQ